MIHDPELQGSLAHDGLAAVDHLITAAPAGFEMEIHLLGALIRLIRQAQDEAEAASRPQPPPPASS